LVFQIDVNSIGIVETTLPRPRPYALLFAPYLNCGIVGTLMFGGGGGATLEAFPIPLGSTNTLVAAPIAAPVARPPLPSTLSRHSREVSFALRARCHAAKASMT
jgi:hypothetical protein